MSVTLTENDVTRYVGAVREALSDLPAAQRDELLDDLAQHLQEVAAEGDVPLSVRLGSPAAYAEELRASIGLAAEPPARPGGRLQRLVARLPEARDAVVTHPAGRAAVDFLPELRSGWWVLRGYLFVAVPSVLWDYAGQGSFPWPTVSGSRKLGLLVTLAAIVASVAIGRRAVRGPHWRRLVVVGNTLLVLAALVAFGPARADSPPAGFAEPAWAGYLTAPDGRPIVNIFPYGADGRPLTGVRLYDQDGRPIDRTYPDYGDGGYKLRYPTDAYGNQVTNAYPLQELGTDPNAPPPSGSPPAAVPPLASASPPVSPSAGQSGSSPATPPPTSPVAPSPQTSPPAPQPTP